MLKVYNYDIVFQEVPNETTLALNISNCPYHCEGCHSPVLWTDKGLPVLDVLEGLLVNYHNFITCVCFMGGDQDMEELTKALTLTKEQGLKTCLYTGADTVEQLTTLFPHLDYLKYGSYKKALGGLDSPTTNQKFLKKENEVWNDYTYKFRK
jgi:anaerobic ribonucleoside-triphosphate reductase activating protein